jgi:hypothetical protein
MKCYETNPIKSAQNFASNINKLSSLKSRKNIVEDWIEAFKTSPVFTAYVVHYVDECKQGELLSNLEFFISK